MKAAAHKRLLAVVAQPTNDQRPRACPERSEGTNDLFGDGFVDMNDAERLTGWSASTVKRFFREHGSSVKKRRVNGFSKHFLPATLLPIAAQARLREEQGHAGGPRPSAKFDAAPEWARTVALAREKTVKDWLRARSLCERGEQMTAIRDFVAARIRNADDDEAVPSVSTLMRWTKDYGEDGRDGLLPEWGQNEKYAVLSEEEKDFLLALWADPECPDRTVQVCLDAYAIRRRRELGPRARCASYSTVRDFLGEPENRILKFWAKNGMDETVRRFGPFITRTRRDAFRALAYVGDHHQFDFPVVSSDGRRVLRPWVSAWIDYASTLWVGWDLNENPNTDTVKTSLLRALEWATPHIAHIDNGKDYRSKALEGEKPKTRKGGRRYRIAANVDDVEVKGIFQYLGIDVVHALPYNARSKVIERHFQQFAKRFSTGIPGHLGNSVANRNRGGDALVEKTKRAIAEGKPVGREHGTCLTWAEFTDLFHRFIRWANEERETAAEGVKGRTAIEAWMNDAAPVRDTDPDALWMVFLKSDTRVAARCRVTLLGAQYQSTDLAAHEGRSVRLRYHPDDLTRVYVHDLADRLICVAPRVEGTAAYTGDTSKAIAEQKRHERDFKTKSRLADLARLKVVRDKIGTDSFGIPESRGPEIERPAPAVVNLTALSGPAREAALAVAAMADTAPPAPSPVNDLLTANYQRVRRPLVDPDEAPLWTDLPFPTIQGDQDHD